MLLAVNVSKYFLAGYGDGGGDAYKNAETAALVNKFTVW
jgi:hypothetical protein